MPPEARRALGLDPDTGRIGARAPTESVRLRGHPPGRYVSVLSRVAGSAMPVLSALRFIHQGYVEADRLMGVYMHFWPDPTPQAALNWHGGVNVYRGAAPRCCGSLAASWSSAGGSTRTQPAIWCARCTGRTGLLITLAELSRRPAQHRVHAHAQGDDSNRIR